MRIGVVNAGNIGRTLSRAWLDAGHELLLAKDGSQAKLDAFAEAYPSVRRGTPSEAAAFGEVILFSVYWPRLDAILAEIGSLAGKVVIDTMNPLQVGGGFEHSHDKAFMAQSSTTEELQRRCPAASVVKAFNTMASDLLNQNRWRETQSRPPVFLAGDDPVAKATVTELAKDAGFEAVDTGPSTSARSIEQLGILMHLIADSTFDGDLTRLAPAVLVAPEPDITT
ncbi:NAD(P)-binding domain-containing protein [Mycobacterium sp. 236(2023)]|uniref:NADPH-dependent F420 reductase n=1 Tax=Mycobacterium sp. 236(2023) TaxID=3038163 RepID=UPI002415828E|nr:NAD(P)-binding domain-containing protein [Mycobacterium sp. 236(2023)]MDG4667444.1 NAD(P)-binding domain-containing protein [Mycobacterium sp. 236(2023)]